MRLFNNTIFLDELGIIGCSTYFKEFEIYDENYTYNNKLSLLIDLIGKYNSNDIKSKKGSHRHKGLKKVQLEFEKHFNEKVSITEIKSLIKSYTRFFSHKKYLKCPYNMDKILICVVKVSAEKKSIIDVFNRILKSELKKDEFEKNCYLLLLSIYYVNLKKKLADWDQLSLEKGKKLYFEGPYNKLLKLKNNLKENFKHKCEILN